MSGQLGTIPYPMADANRWEDDPSTPWIRPAAPQPVTVNVDAGLGGGGTSPAETYVQARVRDQLRAQGYNVPAPQMPVAPATVQPAGGIPTVPIGPDGKPLPGTMSGSDTGPATPPQWLAMLGGQGQPKTPNPPGSVQLGYSVYNADGVLGMNIPGRGYVPLRGQGAPAPAPAAPAAQPVATRPAAAPPSPGWFMPNNPATNQGNSVWRGPAGQQYLDLSPPPLPYEQWQQAQAQQETQRPVDYGSFLARYWGGQPSPQGQQDYQQYLAFMARHPSDPQLQQWIRDHASEEAHVRALA